MILRNEHTQAFEGIACDQCEAHAPSVREIQQKHGLVNMGWSCSGGKHVCPSCVSEEGGD